MSEKEIIEQLSEKLSDDAIQRTDGAKTKKGYNTTGYGYQASVDRFNEVLGEDWNFSWEIIHEETGSYKSGMPYIAITVKVSIGIKDKQIRSCVGGHTASNYADALKGAITNGFKKTAAFWGVGRDAFAGTIDDDNEPLPDSDANKIKDKFQGQDVTIEVMKMKTKDLSEYATNYFRDLKYGLKEVYNWCKPYKFDSAKIDEAR